MMKVHNMGLVLSKNFNNTIYVGDDKQVQIVSFEKMRPGHTRKDDLTVILALLSKFECSSCVYYKELVREIEDLKCDERPAYENLQYHLTLLETQVKDPWTSKTFQDVMLDPLSQEEILP